MESLTSYWRRHANSLVKADANCGPLSDISKSWRPKCLNTWWRKSLATPAVSMAFEQGMRIIVRPWSTTTINESCPLDQGRSVTRSTDSCLKGRGDNKGMGANGG